MWFGAISNFSVRKLPLFDSPAFMFIFGSRLAIQPHEAVIFSLSLNFKAISIERSFDVIISFESISIACLCSTDGSHAKYRILMGVTVTLT